MEEIEPVVLKKKLWLSGNSKTVRTFWQYNRTSFGNMEPN